MWLYRTFVRCVKSWKLASLKAEISRQKPSRDNVCYPSETITIRLFKNNQQLGSIKGSKVPSDRVEGFYIYNIETQPNSRRLGIGTRLLQEMQQVAGPGSPMTPLHETSSSHLFWSHIRQQRQRLNITLNDTVYIDQIADEKAKW